MTDKQWNEFLKMVGTRIEREVEKYGRWSAIQVPTRQQANYIYDKIRDDMKRKSAATGKKNTNYMRTMVNAIFDIHNERTPVMSKKEYQSTYFKRWKEISKSFGIDMKTAREIVDIVPPTATDLKYGRKSVSDFWEQVESMQKRLRSQGISWIDINQMVGVAYFGKEY